MKRKRLEDYVTVERRTKAGQRGWWRVVIAGEHIVWETQMGAQGIAANIKRGLRAAQKEMERANDATASRD